MKLRKIQRVESSYRRPMTVKELLWYRKGGERYPCCPRCGRSFEREYVAFCVSCGQRLDWKDYERAVIRLR